jgi:hypothetical protein
VDEATSGDDLVRRIDGPTICANRGQRNMFGGNLINALLPGIR